MFRSLILKVYVLWKCSREKEQNISILAILHFVLISNMTLLILLFAIKLLARLNILKLFRNILTLHILSLYSFWVINHFIEPHSTPFLAKKDFPAILNSVSHGNHLKIKKKCFHVIHFENGYQNLQFEEIWKDWYIWTWYDVTK